MRHANIIEWFLQVKDYLHMSFQESLDKVNISRSSIIIRKFQLSINIVKLVQYGDFSPINQVSYLKMCKNEKKC